MSTTPNIPNSSGMSATSVVLIIPNGAQRQALTQLLARLKVPVARATEDYPDSTSLEELIDLDGDVFIVELDTNAERALALIENICSRGGSAAVMATSASNEPELLLGSMRAGAREFLAEPVIPSILAEALARASARREKRKRHKTAAKMLVFAGSKGGTGATMIATNFAVALAQEEAGKVVAVDLDVQLGEVALGLGLAPKFSLLDALQNVERLDADFLLGLLSRHTCGLWVLASPEPYTSMTRLSNGSEKLFRILRDEFAFVVVDAGPVVGPVEDALLDSADTLYLVTEMSIPALRNARRMLGFIAGRERSPRLEIILNRFNSREVEIDETSAVKALGRPVDWRVPNDFHAVRSAENTGVPLAMRDSPISRVLRHLAKAACGKPVRAEKKSKSLLGLFQ